MVSGSGLKSKSWVWVTISDLKFGSWVRGLRFGSQVEVTGSVSGRKVPGLGLKFMSRSRKGLRFGSLVKVPSSVLRLRFKFGSPVQVSRFGSRVPASRSGLRFGSRFRDRARGSGFRLGLGSRVSGLGFGSLVQVSGMGLRFQSLVWVLGLGFTSWVQVSGLGLRSKSKVSSSGLKVRFRSQSRVQVLGSVLG